jgi:hypothetical protein
MSLLAEKQNFTMKEFAPEMNAIILNFMPLLA